MNFFQRTREAYREFTNFFFIRKIIKRNRKTDEWKKFNLRTGYFNQIYTIVNLRKEDMGEEDSVRQMRIVEKLEPMYKYIENLNLSEIVSVEFNEIENSRSYLIIYWPLKNYFSIWRLFFWLLGIGIIVRLFIKYDLISYWSAFIKYIQIFFSHI